MKRIRSELIALDRLQPWDVAETLLPEYTEQQYQDLEEFLANGGQLAPVVIAEDCRIIDGYNRWRTATRLGINQIECDVYSYADVPEMEMHAIVLNSKRRHLNRLQVARAAARLANLLTPAELEAEETPEVESNTPEADTQESAPETVVEEPKGAEEVQESQPAEVTQKSSPLYSDQVVREASQKLGVSHSTVKQVSKVDKSGDEMLIAAMEDKVITIKQAADIAELEEEQRRKALEALDEEKKKQNNYAGVFSKTCTDCLRKLQRSRKKFESAEFSESECHDMKAAIDKVIGEANTLMLLLNNEISVRSDSDVIEEQNEEQPESVET